tara:strand:+ start:7032 stop:7259 length:228 start_codon:yes stop_codon:yes gene_type:complete
VEFRYMLTRKIKSAKSIDSGRLMQKTFAEGVQGFINNLYNPYGVKGIKHKEWERGYNSAYFNNLTKVLKEEKRRQ